jgi:DNA polymerase (family X)
MDKKAVAATLEEIALLSELAGENPFKVRAYETGARVVLTYPGDLADAVRRGELARIKGIGKSLAAVIAELTEKGEAQVLRDLRERVPAGLLELLQVPGLGPKKPKSFMSSSRSPAWANWNTPSGKTAFSASPASGPKPRKNSKPAWNG